ncbi:MAG: hypothetical protein R3D29_12500 [Nitratireductor sp.]
MAVSTPLTRLIRTLWSGNRSMPRAIRPIALPCKPRTTHSPRKGHFNICTAQALLANMSAAYAIWHGPEGLTGIATAIHDKAQRLASALENVSIELVNQTRFDTVTVKQSGNSAAILSRPRRRDLFSAPSGTTSFPSPLTRR